MLFKPDLLAKACDHYRATQFEGVASHINVYNTAKLSSTLIKHYTLPLDAPWNILHYPFSPPPFGGAINATYLYLLTEITK